jgi:hypothetical protein
MHQIIAEFLTVVFRFLVLVVVILGPSVFSLSALTQRDPFTVSHWEELPSPLKMLYNYILSLGTGYENF